MKSFLRIPLFCILFFLLSVQIFSEPKHKLSSHAEDLYVYTLQNGMKVFAKYDPLSPKINVRLCVKAGFKNQNPYTSGFFKLASELFFKGASKNEEALLDVLNVKTECNALASSFSADTTSLSADDFLSLLSSHLEQFSASDEELNSAYEELKKSVSDYSKTPSAFINCTVNSKLFERTPWKTDSGVYPALFASLKTGEIRTVLLELYERFYSPERCALFITGNIKPDEAYERASDSFRRFVKKYPSTSFCADSSSYENAVQGKRKFVLLSPSFSKDYTQLLIDFTSTDSAESDIIKASVLNGNKVYLQSVIHNEKLSIPDITYTDLSSRSEGNDNFLVFQALVENTEKVDSASVEELAASLKKAFLLNREEFTLAQKAVIKDYEERFTESISFMELLSGFWSMSDSSSEDFYSSFLDFKSAPLMRSAGAVSKKINSEEPYIFVIMNPSVFKESEEDFKENGFTVINEGDGYWYSDVLYKNALEKALQEKLLPSEEELFLITGDKNVSSDDRFYFLTSREISETVLSNGIPVAVRNIPSLKKAVLCIGIEGGELSSPENERLLRTVLSDCVASNIRSSLSSVLNKEFSVEAVTEETVSFILIEFSPDELSDVLKNTVSSVVFGEIRPLVADNAANYRKYIYRNDSMSLYFQLKNLAFRKVFEGSELKKMFSAKDDVLKNTTMLSLRSSYAALLDASLYSVSVSGAVNKDNVFSECEKYFSILKETSQRKVMPSFRKTLSGKKHSFELIHTFTTDRDPSEAGTEVPVLVPTSTFLDPALMIFSAPEDRLELELFNALILELSSRITGRLPSGAVSYEKAGAFFSYGIISADKLESLSSLENAYAESLKEVGDALKNEDDFFLKNLKTRWELSAFSSKKEELLLHKGLLLGNPSLYLDGFLSVKNASFSDVLSVMESCFPEKPFTAYSKTLKK